MNTKKYDVVLSFAGEDREHASALAESLRQRDVIFFFDEDKKAELWGKNLYDDLSDIYQNCAHLCVMFLSKYYAEKPWTDLERKAAQARRHKENYEYIISIRLDDTPIPGILGTEAFLNWYDEGAERIADAIVVKLQRLLQEPRSITSVQVAGFSANDNISKLSDACQIITRAFIAELDQPVTIPRPALQRQLDAFLSTRIRYCFVIGASGVGKSTALACEASRLQQQGWIVLLLRGKDFSTEKAGLQIRQHCSTYSGKLDWHQVVQLFDDKAADSESKFILMIDAVDVAETSAITQELESLHHSIVTKSLERVKVIITCRDVAWADFRARALPDPFEDINDRIRESANSYQTITLGDFTSNELDNALKEIGADELIVLRPRGQWIDPHVTSLRALLLHPQNFGYFAELRSSGGIAGATDWTWSDLIHCYLEKMLHRVAKHTQRTTDELRQMLRRVAAAGWHQHSRDLSLDIESLKAEVPELFLQADAVTPFVELVNNGLLIEGDKIVSFRLTDTGGWLLSLELQAQFEACSVAERADLLNQWLSEASDYHPMFDAVLAWLDRLSAKPDDPQLLDLLQRIIDSGRYEDIFRLLKPSVVGSLFLLLIRNEEENQYFYSQAGSALRPSPEALKEIRFYLTDLEAKARRFAAQLAGIHGDEQAIPDLLNLLVDEDFNVHQAASQAIERIGKSALSSLLIRIKDVTQTNKMRAACLHALRDMGELDDDISDIMSQALKSNDETILRAAVLAATLYRDKKQQQLIIPLLQHENHYLVQCAAKYFAEVPTTEAFAQLEQAARWHFAAGEENVKSFSVFRELAAALIKTDREAALPLILEFVREGIAGKKTFPIHIIIDRGEKLHLPEAFRPVLTELARQLVQIDEAERGFNNIRRLGELWHPDHLDVLTETAKELAVSGIDLPHILVEQVAQHIAQHDEFPIAEGLNRVKDLQLLAKCQVHNLIPSLCELLPITPDLSTRELCEWLWVAADPQAEKGLLTKLRNNTGKGHWYFAYTVMRALGTCGGHTAKDEILQYLRKGGEIALDFPQEILHPLLYRRELLPDELIALTLDSQMPIHSRMCSLLALANWDAPAQHEVIQQIASDSNDAKLQAQAVRLLYFTKDTSIISFLRKMLRDRNCHLSVREEAATVLGWLGETETLAEIERVFGNTPTRGFIHTLVHFKSESSLPVILAGVKEKRWEMLGEYIEALGAFAHLPQGRTAIQEQFEEWASGREDHLDLQSHLIAGLAAHHPVHLLQTIVGPYDKKHLHARGKKTLAKEIRGLIVKKSVEWSDLLPIMTRLISDEDLLVRETALQGLVFATPDFCRGLFEEIWAAPNADEWSRAAAVVVLGYTENEGQQLGSFRYDADLLVRQAADIALKNRARHSALKKQVSRFQSTNGIERLSAWLCLTQEGDWATAKLCLDACPKDSIRYAFQKELTKRITDNDKKAMEKQKRDQQSFGYSRGSITFD